MEGEDCCEVGKIICKCCKCVLKGRFKYVYLYTCFFGLALSVVMSIIMIFVGVLVRYVGIGFYVGLQFLEGFGMKVLGAFLFYGGIVTLVLSALMMVVAVIVYWVLRGKDRIEEIFSGENTEKKEKEKRIRKQRKRRGKKDLKKERKDYALLHAEDLDDDISSDDFEF